jgi:hypothetical protein
LRIAPLTKGHSGLSLCHDGKNSQKIAQLEGNTNSHVTTNLPVIFAGGGFRHGQHLAFDTERNYPLPNLYVSMLQQLGIETDRFASSTGTMRGLDVA